MATADYRVSDADIDAFWRDGAVCLRGAMPSEWLERMAAPLEQTLADATMTNLSSFGEEMRDAAGAELLIDGAIAERAAKRGYFRAGTDHWLAHDEFRDFAFHSPLPAIVAQLMRSTKINFYEDSVLVKEPGTRERTAFHQDMAYFHVEGTKVCTTWVPLDPVRFDTGAVQFVKGSHLWKRQWRPNLFVTTMPLPDTEGDEVPDYFRERDKWDIVWWETEPGDITVHHARTLHGAEGNASATQRRRAISVRYCGDDAVYKLRRGAPLKPHHGEIKEGDPLDHPRCPVVWPAA